MSGGGRGADGRFTHRSVGPIQLVSVLSISLRIRSCSAAASMLAILHVAAHGSELSRAGPSRAEMSRAERIGLAESGSVRQEEEPEGLVRCFHRAARVSGVSLVRGGVTKV